MTTHDVIEIDDEILLDVLQDPMRTRVMRHLASPKSVRELAAELGVPASRLYHHLHLLQRHGAVEVIEQRSTAGRTENIYRSLIRSYRIAPSLEGTPVATSGGALLGALDDMVATMATAIGHESEHPTDGVQWMTNMFGHLTKERANEFVTRYNDLLFEFFGDDVQVGNGEGALYGQMFLLLPFAERPDYLA